MVVAAGFGLANAVVAVVLLLLVPHGSPATGWFAYAPLADHEVPPRSGSQTDWALIVTPAALVVLNVLLVLLVARRRWLAPQ